MYRYKITGIVQGVGFRPYVLNECVKAHLNGYVQNVGDGVIAVVDNTEKFEKILEKAPLPIRVDTFKRETFEGKYSDFQIVRSEGTGYAEIPPDLFLCKKCLRDLNTKKNRRYGYYFLTCTTCGPRFTISRRTPFDRKTTSMKDFPLCEHCNREYCDPNDRRFHAQTIACPQCGPKLRLFKNGREISKKTDDAYLRDIAQSIEKGNVVAIKGVGGFHLACSTDPSVLMKLNDITKRSDKPYAVLCKDIAMARTIARINTKEKEALLSPARPIILVKKKIRLQSVSELDTVGIMLPYTALHYLLFRHYHKPIVLTSSNLSNEPITLTKEQQFVPIILDHTREIHHPADDSIVKVIRKIPILIRRSRGFVPQSITVRTDARQTILGMGADMNNTFALYDGSGRIILSQHLGNIDNPASFERYKRTIDRFLHLIQRVPRHIVCDPHPGYRSSHYAQELALRFSARVHFVQHHRAHIWGAAQENDIHDFVGISCDGMGYGDDGSIWGGEIFHNNERIGHLEQHLLPGGDSATRHPAKMLFSILRKSMSFEESARYLKSIYSRTQLRILDQQLALRMNTPTTTSCGRVLDAAAALLGLCYERTYDGRSAMLLESNSSKPYDLAPVLDGSILLTTPLFQYLLKNRHRDSKRLAATVQYYLAQGLYSIAHQKKKPIVWAGGCVYNRIMTSFMIERGVLVNKTVPPGDGGISFGQIANFLANSGHDIS